MDTQKIEQAITMLLEAVGEDPNREGLKETPARVARMYQELLGGMDKDGKEHLSKVFSAPDSEIVVEKNIEFYSLCEHHMLPFFGNVHIAYIPNGKVVGLSKMGRLVEVYARRLQIQERMTGQIADELEKALDAKGVLVVIEAEHLCMTMRGIKKRGARTVSYASRGVFREDPQKKQEALALMGVTG
ncbi:MAG: GTP cyclohydrolase I FolE [Lachnospiraceae bacterium]|nr:GTP cyclohydrolase I FolE [Lachnospiraceae bacterium]MCR4733164.1 GTP cyclohydrolase I FolE [Lachnospiraceae bacterium]MEE3355832.1 GTP cyclohydrolase I FolE [Candidatus Weimeria sp.]